MKYLNEVLGVLRNHVYDLSSEKLVQQAMENLLTKHVIPFEREVRLDEKDRIDFLIADGLGIEVKLDGTLTKVTRQLCRYAQHDEIKMLLLITTKPQLAQLPGFFNNKEIRTLVLLANLI